MSGPARIRLEKRIEEIEKEVSGWSSEATEHAMMPSEFSRQSLTDLLAQ